MALVCECGHRIEVSAPERQRLNSVGGRVTCPKCGKSRKVGTKPKSEPAESPTTSIAEMLGINDATPSTVEADTAMCTTVESTQAASVPPPAETPTKSKTARYKWAGLAALAVVLALSGLFLGRGSEAKKQKPARDGNELADVIEEIEPAVIVLDVTLKDGRGIGSGFVVESGGIAVTNHHVLDGATKAMARFADGHESEVEGVLFADPDRDLAIIKLADVGKRPNLKLSDKLPRKGELTIAFGAPKGLTFTATEGIVSAIRNDSDAAKDGSPKAGTFIQTSTPISQGNSGGPLLNRQGEVIGVNTISLVSGQNLNFAVASTEVIDALDLSKDQPVKPLPIRTMTSNLGMNSLAPQKTEIVFTESQKAFLKTIGKQIEDRRQRATELRTQVEKTRQRAKQGSIEADNIVEASTSRELQSLGNEMKTLATRELEFPYIELEAPKTGEIGSFGGAAVEILQVLSKDQGACLAAPISRRSIGKAIRLRGLDLSSVVDGDRLTIAESLVFEITGTHTYPTVNGGTNTVFDALCILNAKQLSENLDKDGVFKVDLSVPALNKDEQAKRAANLEVRRQQEIKGLAKKAEDDRLAEQRAEEMRKQEFEASRAAAERKALAAAARKEKEDRQEAEKKAASKLALAKTFLKSMKRDIARNRLQEIIEEYPDTSAAEEAEKLLVSEKLLQ